MNLAKAIGVGALGLLAVSGWTLWNNITNKKQPPSKDEILEILETVRQQFYPIMVRISQMVSKELAPKGLTPQQNEKIVMLDPTIKEEIEHINEKIYAKYSEEEVEETIDKIYAQDGDIKHHQKEFKQQYIKSLMGVTPERQIIVTRKINRDKVLQAVRDILQDKVDRLATQIGAQFNEEQIQAFLQSDVEEDERVTKQIIKRELGLIAKDSIKIFHFVVVQYQKQQIFRQKYQEIIQNYNRQIKKLIPS